MDSLWSVIDFIRDIAVKHTVGSSHIHKAAAEAFNERKDVIRRALNKKVLIPNILAFMPAWLSEFQPDVDEINLELDEWLQRFVSNYATTLRFVVRSY